MRRLLILAMYGCGDDVSQTIDAAGDGSPTDTAGTCAPGPGWTAAPALARGPTQETATVAAGGKLYVLGGFDENAGVLSTVQVFDTTTCVWSAGPALPRAVHHINATTIGTTIWVTGAMETLNFTSVGHVWSWDTSSAADWTVHAAMPANTQRGSSVVGAIGTTIYIAGGLRNGAVPEVTALDTLTSTWTTALPPLPGNRDHGCGGVIGGKLYVLGGRAGNITARTGSVEEYTPGGAWVSRAPMPTARGGTACGVIGDRFIVVGGEGNPAVASGVFAEVEAYTPATNTWETLVPMVSPRHGMGAAVVNGALYVPGGADRQAFAAVATHDVFIP